MQIVLQSGVWKSEGNIMNRIVLSLKCWLLLLEGGGRGEIEKAEKKMLSIIKDATKIKEHKYNITWHFVPKSSW